MGIRKRIHEKPSHVRTQYAFSVALLTTLSIAVVWATTLPARFTSFSHITNDMSQSADLKDIREVLDDGKDQLANSMQALQDISVNTENTAETRHMDSLGNSEFHVQSTTTTSTTPNISNQKVATSTELITHESVATEDERMGTQIENNIPLPQPYPKVILIGTSTSPKTD
ncbi:MAG TPA: hypothetical protein VFV22_02175 [Candidatus Paceibacterota bacterium]|nr:hypothetical protein [Candidatus Paceibacterota bacterium]